MNHKNIFAVILIVLATTRYFFAAPPPPAHLFSLDLSYTRIGITNNGWGAGIAYEQLVCSHLSAKGAFGHMTFQTSIDDLYCTTVDLSLLVHWYLLSKHMEKLYIGAGCTTDFLNYFGPASVPDHKEDSIIYFDSILGWKLFFLRKFLLDIHTGYNIIINGADNYPDFQKYGQGGLQSAVSLKYLL
jgi:hypothetical protein